MGVIHFVNADLIASGLSPLKPELAAIAPARVVLREIDRLAAERMDFAFETTFSGLTYVRRLQAWKQAGYRIEMVYLRLRSVQLALRRIAARVRQGGHDVPRLTSSGGSQEAGGTFSASTGLWPTAGLCTTIQAVHHDYWRKVREG